MHPICLILLLIVEVVRGKSDLASLLELKNGIEKDQSGKVVSSWDSSKSLASNGCPLEWYGVSCSDGRVTEIVLEGVGLIGHFNFSAISELKMLRHVSISNNQFMGNLEGGVTLMESLEYLDVSSNLFLGSVPVQLANLKNLLFLNLSFNNFDGTVPSNVGKLQKLKYLDLKSNNFSGEVMIFLSQLGNVIYVDLSSNRFSGSLDLGLGSPSFVSTIQYLNISHNNLSGELFSHDGIPYFDNLEVFDASNNKFVGKIPSFNFMFSLRILRLANNFLSGSLPEALLQESSMVLSELDCSHNQLEGQVGSITSTTLKNLNLSSNLLSGLLPAKVGRCATIDLSKNMFTGNLSRFYGWGNYVESIDLSSNFLTGFLHEQTSQFLRLSTLTISNNSGEGVLPLALGMYPELKQIDFSLNQFRGFLPSSLFNSTKLTDINLSFNKLTGTIPITDRPSQEFPQNICLVSLNLSHNGLTGPLPRELSRFHNIMYLDLSDNHFEGIIPDGLPSEIKGFNVSYNNLSGVVPEILSMFPDSSFHPGNTLLYLPTLTFSPKGDPNINSKNHGSHTKPAFRVALIAGLVCGVLVIVLFVLMIYYRIHQQEAEMKSSKRSVESKGIHDKASSVPGVAIVNENANMSSTSVDRSPDQETLSHMRARKEVSGNIIVQKPKDHCCPESKQNGEVISSPVTLTTTANPSPGRVEHLYEDHGSLRVCSPEELAGDLHLFGTSLDFSAEDLSCAPAEVIGRSCHGTLYKALLPSGHFLAVKWLKEGIVKGRKEFAREAKKLGNIKHPNLVSLQGYYWGPMDHEKLIISNYISASSLDLYLQETEPRTFPPLSLDERLKISVDVACCLSYLHNERAIPHGNLKSTNILLETSSLNTFLTDYSLHRLLTSAGTSEQVLNAGALGYRPPEFGSTIKPCPSLKSDVYAFGVILLELLTGKSSAAIISLNNGAVDLTEWVMLLAAENRPTECFDKQINDVHNVEVLSNKLDDMLQVALKCILPATERPDINSVYEDLSLIISEHTSQR